MKRYLAFGILAIGYVAVITVTGIGCPFRWLTGLPCPCCGITHAWWYALTGRFSLAFQSHVFFLLAPLVVLAVLNPQFSERHKALWSVGCLVLGLPFGCLWIYRLFAA